MPKANDKLYARLEFFETEVPGQFYVRGVPGLHLIGRLPNLLGPTVVKAIERLRKDNGDERPSFDSSDERT